MSQTLWLKNLRSFSVHYLHRRFCNQHIWYSISHYSKRFLFALQRLKRCTFSTLLSLKMTMWAFLTGDSKIILLEPECKNQKGSAWYGYGYGYDCGLWRHAPLESVQWPPPVRFSTSGITSGKVIPLKTPPFGCKYSTGEDHIVCQGCSYYCHLRKCTWSAHPQLQYFRFIKGF